MELKFLYIFFVLVLSCEFSFAGFISIVGPRAVQHGEKYTFFLSAMDFNEGDKVKIEITGKKYGELVVDKELDLKNMNSTVSYDLSRTFQDYTMRATVARENFDQSIDIFTIAKRYSVFVQTDKTLYKPGDTVKFRVLVIDVEMKPYKLNKVIVELIDPFGNVVGELEEEDEDKLMTGVTVGDFKIATEPYMGKWKLRAKTIVYDEDDEDIKNEVITDQEFEVKEYVSPLFEVFVDTKPDVMLSESLIRLTIYANYGFGELVKGKAVITARVYASKFPETIQTTVSRTIDVNNRKMVEFHIKNDLKISSLDQTAIVKFDVMFEETLTEQKISKMTEVHVHKTGAINLDLVTEKNEFKPGFPFNFKAVVRMLDGSLATDSSTSVTAKVNYIYETPSSGDTYPDDIDNFEFNRNRPLKDGVAEFSFDVSERASTMNITIIYKDVQKVLNFPKKDSKSRDYLVIKSTTEEPKINQEVTIEVKGNGEWEKTYIVVISRSKVVYSNVHLKDKEIKNFNFQISSDKTMAPSVQVIVYYFHAQGEIVYDQIQVDFHSLPTNKLELKLSKNTAKPGEKLSIECTTTANSSIFLFAVEQAVNLIESGNEINKPRIIAEMSSFNTLKSDSKSKVKRSTENLHLNFEEFNTFILTNGQIDGKSKCLTSPDRFQSEIKSSSEDESEDNRHDFEKPANSEQQGLRENFPETWIFENFEADNHGKLKFVTEVPNTISSFIITGFAVHPEHGLAIAKHQKVTVVQEFFLKLIVPYSVRLGEVVKVDVIVFNYISRPQETLDVKVEMFNNDAVFEFVDARMVGNECIKTTSSDTIRSKTISVPTKSGAATFFLIKPKVTGEITLNVKAIASGKQIDEVKRFMLVEHEGLKISDNIVNIFDLRQKDRDAFYFVLPIDEEKLIPNSIAIEASVIGDVMGPALTNISSLILIPKGDEETMFRHWILNFPAMEYLQAISKLTDDYRISGEQFLAKGYQHILEKRNVDGSYSLWGETRDANIWLTAYVAKCLNHAKRFIPISDKHIVGAFDYVVARQESDGSFPEQTHSYYNMKTKSQHGVSLTAFCAIAMLEKIEYKIKYKTNIDKALSYIKSMLPPVEDNFSIAIAAYALALNKDESANDFIELLKRNAFQRNDEMFWYNELRAFKTSESPSVSVEIAAYALMAFCTVGKPAEAIPIVKWLMTQHSSTGRFYGATDTVLGLQALTMISAIFYTPNVNMELKVEYNNNQFKTFNINSRNVQYQEIEKNARSFYVKAIGNGIAFFKLSYQYNTILESYEERFALSADPIASENQNELTLKICANFIPDGNIFKSQMTLIEIHLPSGFVYNPETAKLVEKVGVRMIETEKQKTVIILYFDEITSTKICFEVKAIRENISEDLKDSVVKVYDYFDNHHRATAFYNVNGDNLCKF